VLKCIIPTTQMHDLIAFFHTFIQFQVPKCTSSRTHIRRKQFPKIFNIGVAYSTPQIPPLQVAGLPGLADFFLGGEGSAVSQLFLCNSHTGLQTLVLNRLCDMIKYDKNKLELYL
jgi:hypothetical protein